MKIGMLIAAMAVIVSSGALAAEVAKPETKMEWRGQAPCCNPNR